MKNQTLGFLLFVIFLITNSFSFNTFAAPIEDEDCNDPFFALMTGDICAFNQALIYAEPELSECLIERLREALDVSEISLSFIRFTADGGCVYHYHVNDQQTGYVKFTSMACDAGLIFDGIIDGL